MNRQSSTSFPESDLEGTLEIPLKGATLVTFYKDKKKYTVIKEPSTIDVEVVQQDG